MARTSFADRREVQRLRRWLETAGASWRLLTPVCTSSSLRHTVLDGLSAGGSMRLLRVDVREGDIVPAVFRDYRGTHTSYTLFSFEGLAERVARDGTAALTALDTAHQLFERPATWALWWLEDPALVCLIARHAPRFHARIELQPTFPDPTLFAASGPTALHTLVQEVAQEGRASGTGAELGGRILLERGDLRAVEGYLRRTSLDPETWLLLHADAALLAGDGYVALAHLAAACGIGGVRHGESCVAAAEVLRQLGDFAGAAALLEHADSVEASERARMHQSLTSWRLSGSVAALDAAFKAASAQPTALFELGRALSPSLPARAVDAFRLCSALSADPILRAQAAAELGLLLVDEKSGDAETLLRPLLEAPDDEVRIRARRGLARLALSRASDGRANDNPAALLVEAAGLLDQACAIANERGLVRAHIDSLWDRVSVAAAREDLDGILTTLAKLDQLTNDAGLRQHRFEVLQDRSRALRHARRLADASGTLDELSALSLDLVMPEFEIRAMLTRGEHLRALGATDDARKLYERAADLASHLGQHDRASELRESIAQR